MITPLTYVATELMKILISDPSTADLTAGQISQIAIEYAKELSSRIELAEKG